MSILVGIGLIIIVAVISRRARKQMQADMELRERTLDAVLHAAAEYGAATEASRGMGKGDEH